MDRRAFLAETFGATVLARVSADLLAQTGSPPASASWDPGQVRHLLPTVSDTRMLIKVSFTQPLSASPMLRIGGQNGAGRDERYARASSGSSTRAASSPAGDIRSRSTPRGAALCQPWELSTLPDANARPDRFRVLFFTCAGGHDALGFVPPRHAIACCAAALSFQPQAAVANGDHVYWDLLAPRASQGLGASPEAGTAGRHLHAIGGRVWRHERDGAEAGRGPADRSGLRHRLPFDAGVLPAGRPRLLRERRSHRRDRHIPAIVVHVAAGASNAAAVLPGVPARRHATRAACRGRRRRPRRGLSESFGTLRFGRLAGDPALRRAAHDDASPDRARCSWIPRSRGGCSRAPPHRGDPPRARAFESARMERREVGRVVSRTCSAPTTS